MYKCGEVQQDVIVCFAAGQSRSTSLLLAFLAMHSNSRSLHDALSFIKVFRPSVNPNEGFMRPLARFYITCSDSKDESIALPIARQAPKLGH